MYSEAFNVNTRSSFPLAMSITPCIWSLRFIGRVLLLLVLTTAAAQAQIKWNPGHYAHTDARPQVPGMQSRYNSEMADMAAVINPSTGLPGFKGWQGEYPWFRLEPEAPTPAQIANRTGTYDTSLIDADLAQLALLSAAATATYHKPINFKLIIVVSTYNYSHSMPVVPQDTSPNSRAAIPDYLVTGVTPGGDVFPFLTSVPVGLLAWWHPKVVDRMIALQNYLGARYDSNPEVEFIWAQWGKRQWSINCGSVFYVFSRQRPRRAADRCNGAGLAEHQQASGRDERSRCLRIRCPSLSAGS